MRVQLSGRLGNQLFELAHGIKLSKERDKRLTLVWDDFSFPRGMSHDLSEINLNCLEKSNFLGFGLKILDKIKKHSPTFESLICRTIGIYREEHQEKTQKARIVTGFYQDFQWADNSRQELNDLLSKASMHTKHSIDKLQLPAEYQVLHYRSGDFFGHDANFGVLSLDYYRENLDKSLPAIVLTDSPSQAEKIFEHMDNIRIISPSECDAWSALVVMSEAKLIVGSNSTLSWWGAYFAIQKSGKAVIPVPFYANGSSVKLYHPDFSTSRSIFDERNEK